MIQYIKTINTAINLLKCSNRLPDENNSTAVVVKYLNNSFKSYFEYQV